MDATPADAFFFPISCSPIAKKAHQPRQRNSVQTLFSSELLIYLSDLCQGYSQVFHVTHEDIKAGFWSF